MTVIVLEVYEALIEAGASKEKAKAAAAAIPRADRLATKEDISRLERDIAKLEHVTTSHIADLRDATKGDITRLESATKADIAKLDKNVAVLKLAVFTFEPAIIALLVKLLFFP